MEVEARKTRMEVEEDRISGLPEDIIHDHIFRFLPNKYIKVTSSLSKSWYHLSNSFHEIDFNNYAFGLESGFGEEVEDENKNWPRFRFLEKLKDKYLYERIRFPGEEDKYLNYVEQTLQRFHDHNSFQTIIRKLSIPLIFTPRLAPFLDRWIELVLQHGVEDLNIKFRNPKKVQPHYYDLPQALFDANSMIKQAVFTRCSLMHSFPSPNPSPSSLMRKLSLDKVLLDETTLCHITSSCPFIEELSLSNCLDKLNCLGISNFHKLKSLSIYDDQYDYGITVIEIDAPSLQSLDIQGSCLKIRILGSCPILTDLYLQNLHELDSQDILSRLPFLQRLCFVNIETLAKLKVSSETLNKLTILSCHNLVELYIDAPNLLSVDYQGSSIPLLAYSSTHTARWYVTTGYYRILYASLVSKFRTVEDFMVELINFVSKIKLVDLDFEEIHEINLSELKRRVVHPPVAHIDNLNLCLQGTSGYNNCILDCVLWSYHPRTLSMELKMANDGYIFHICRIIMSHRGDCCSCTLDRSNWLHRVEDVIHVKKDGTESRLLMDGTSAPYSNSRYNCGEIKVIFKW